MAMMEDKTTPHGPLECIFTTEEETTMNGAINLEKRPFLQAQALLNVDSEEDNRICVGCAGGMETKIFLPVSADTTATDKDWVPVKLALAGLVGGHTGLDIHTNRGNAIQLVARLVLALVDAAQDSASVRLVSFSGGNAPNAIPRDATCVLAVRRDARFGTLYSPEGIVAAANSSGVRAVSSVSAVGAEGLIVVAKAYVASLIKEIAIAEAKGKGGQRDVRPKCLRALLHRVFFLHLSDSSSRVLLLSSVPFIQAALAALPLGARLAKRPRAGELSWRV